MSAKKNEQIETAVEIPVAAAPAINTAAQFIEIPAKVCVQIGQRKRYFDTKEAAIEALTAFNNKAAGVGKGPKRTFLTPEQKEAKAAQRNVFMLFAEKKGLEGKKQAMLANVLEDVQDDVNILPLIVEFNNKEVLGGSGDAPEAQEEVKVDEEKAVVEPTTVDPLADFGM